MKQLILNLVALTVIGVGGSYLTVQPGTAQDVTIMAKCTQGDIEVCGETCKVNDGGNCECEGDC